MLVGFFLVVALQMVLPTPQPVSATAIRLTLLWQACSQVCIFLLPTLAFARLFHGESAKFLRLDLHGRKWLLGGISIAILLLLLPITDWLTYWNEQWHMGTLEEFFRSQSQKSKELTNSLLSLTSPFDLVLQLLIVALLPAVCEEFFFRGAFQQILQRWFGNMHVAVVVTSMAFAVAHGDVYGLMPRFILGLLLGYLFTLSGSIVVNICAHFFNNAMVVLLYYLFHRQQIYLDPTEPLFFSWSTTIICGLAALMLFILYFTKIITKETTK